MRSVTPSCRRRDVGTDVWIDFWAERCDFDKGVEP